MHVNGLDHAKHFALQLPIALAAVLFASLALSVSTYAAQLTGTVANVGGSPINQATVTACSSPVSLCGIGTASTIADAQGGFSLTLNPGTYTIYAYAGGYLGRFYGDTTWIFPLTPSSATDVTVESDDVGIGQISLDAGDGSSRFCSEPRQGLSNLTKIEAIRPNESSFTDLPIDGAAGAQIGCRVTDLSNGQRVELHLADGTTELSSVLPPATRVKFSFGSPEGKEPHILQVVGGIDQGLSYKSNGYTVSLKTADQISGTLPGILPSRLVFTSAEKPDKLLDLGGDPFKGLVIATNGQFKNNPYVKDKGEPKFSQNLEIEGSTLFAADKGRAQVLLPQALLDWWQAPYSQYLTYLNKSASPLGNVSAQKTTNGALLEAGFTFTSSTTLSWRIPAKYLQRRSRVKQKSFRPNCVVLHEADLPWIAPSKSRMLRVKINCRKRSVLRAWLLGPTKKQIAYLGARNTKGRTTKTHRWRLPRNLRRNHYTLKVRAARAKKKKAEISFVPIRKGVPTIHRGRHSGRTKHGSSRANRINGSSRNDRLFGYGNSDRLRGRRGNDLLQGGPGSDRLWAGSGLDILIGGLGNDVLRGNSGNDLLIAGMGEDRIYGGTGNDMIRAGSGNDQINPGNGDDFVQASDGDDVIREAFGNDRLSGGNGMDRILGRRGSDHITGGEGDDRLYGGPGRDSINGGQGNDLLKGQRSPDILNGGPGNDNIHGGSNPDYILGGPGDDRIFPGGDTDTVDAGAGDDYIDSADHLKEEIDCGSGKDTIRMYRYKSALPGSYTNEDKVKRCEIKVYVPYSDDTSSDDPSKAGNVISGTKKSDTLKGTIGPDTILGRDGNDVIFGKAGDDVLEGEKGNDRIRGGSGKDTMSGRSGNDWMWGGSGNDVINGNRGNDHLYGGSGNDRIRGGFGKDVIRGGPGNDRIVSVGPKNEIDRISCGRGKDVVHANRRDRVTKSCEKVVRR